MAAPAPVPASAPPASAPPRAAGPARTPEVGTEPPPPARPATSRAKRALDIAVVLVTLPVVAVVGAVVALLVAASSRGPILFSQERVGLGGRPFKMYKFRTMRPDAEGRLQQDAALWDEYVRNGYKLPAEIDRRITRVGRFLRRSSLDELPQVLNVLLGTMSLVGPRPIVPQELENYGSHRDAYMSVRPGITGAWQVNGRSNVDYPERVEYDRQYIESWSLRRDLVILLRTPVAVLTARGAF
ncbi:MAG TPA: sugar transferase [Acidimicrobiales bacterium]